ncbi:hypothetical protein [uncultured Ruminococcus sp.]|uniref:hypothetical protein n=1 Tax=uncultured Ruminococcus sp. TaxID=165186 RepID=UPI0025F59D68|nr:hypothetical protein [uncultured Ruminococcus sp.]
MSKNTEPDGSDIEKSQGGIINPSKLGIYALQIVRFECSDTQLARGFHPCALIMTSPTDIKINLSKHGNSFPQES